MSAWPAAQQVLVGPFQQIPGLTAAAAAAAATNQRPVTQQILPENLAHQQMLSDNWRQSIVLDGFDSTSLAQLVSHHYCLEKTHLNYIVYKTSYCSLDSSIVMTALQASFQKFSRDEKCERSWKNTCANGIWTPYLLVLRPRQLLDYVTAQHNFILLLTGINDIIQYSHFMYNISDSCDMSSFVFLCCLYLLTIFCMLSVFPW